MYKKIYNVKALWDNEAEVWVAESDDIPGLITEAETQKELEDKLRIMIPELLIENAVINNVEQSEISIKIHEERDIFMHIPCLA